MLDTDIKVLKGLMSAGVYLVKYDEDLWFKFTDEAQEFCKQKWIEEAQVAAGCKEVALQLVPDPLFPIHGKEVPYIIWRHKFANEEKKDFIYVATVRIDLVDPYPTMSVEVRNKLRSLLAKYPKGTKYDIYYRGAIMKKGTVN